MQAGPATKPNHVHLFTCQVSNHDNHRASSRRGARDIDAMLVLLLTLRGTPTIYYGEEIGMEDVPVSYNDTQDPPAKRLGPVGDRTSSLRGVNKLASYFLVLMITFTGQFVC